MDQPQESLKQARQVRLFVSSTFRDMQAERDELVKRVFPQLRKLCTERGVTWGEVDLRWGVTEEQKAEGRVLPICLEEIRRCRPYFIGLLGERYGWIPDEIPQELLESQPWLAEHRHHSVTELEILHGVLNDPEMAGNAFFYFRSPDYIQALPVSQHPLHLEEPTAEEIQELGKEEAQRRAQNRREKLTALKERIRSSGFPLREGYPDPLVLGEWVLQDLTALIDRIYPQGEQPDPLDRQAAEHEAFVRSRAGVYIGRQAYTDALDAHARGNMPPLVVLGESGSGKSALLANWARHYRQAHPEDLLLLHFIGATPASADWASMLRRILGEFNRRFDLKIEIPDAPDALRSTFANTLGMAAARGRVVLVLDALNQLEDRDGAPDLVWLPPVIPETMRLVLSTLPGRALDELHKRGWATLQVELLDVEERRQLTTAYLAQYSKALSAAQCQRIAAAPQAANPLYLRTLLDELRLFGVHERLDERISHYLEAQTPDYLYEKVLARCEADYERERAGLVADAMSLLWAARRGLAEAELLELLGAPGQPLPTAHWSPLSLALEGSLLSRGGLSGFAHDHLRQAVQDRYLPGAAAQTAAHLRLAEYFARRPIDPRQVDELPWQYARAGAWKELFDLLSDLPFLKAAWEANAFEVKAHWTQVEANSPHRLVQAYRPVIQAPAEYADHAWRIAMLLADTGHPVEALSLREFLVEHYRQTGDRAKLQGALVNQALILRARGDLHGAMALNKEAERICRELGNKAGLSASLGNQANILHARGDLDGAMALQKEKERLCRELGNKDGLQISLGNQALILQVRGDLDGAMRLHQEEERLCRELGNKDGLSTSLANQANILKTRGDLDGAMALYKEQEHLCRDLGNKDGLQASLGGQALILADHGDLDGAMALHKEEERLCRELGNKDGLQRSLGNQAAMLYDRGDLEGAMTLHQEKERLCRELGNKDGLQRTLGNQALILQIRGDLDGAMALHKEQERLCRELGNKYSLARALIHQASILGLRQGQPQKALSLADEAYDLATGSGFASLVKHIEGIRAQIRARLG